jgi:hypothetical protein
VVADDEHFLATYGGRGGTRLGRTRLFPGSLPAGHEARKAAKPDLEALAQLPGDGLLAIGSGSRPERRRGVYLPEGPGGPVRHVDLGPLYDHLGDRLGRINIEGGAGGPDVLRLLQRGNKSGRNAVIDLDLSGVLDALRDGLPFGAELVRRVRTVRLGKLDGVRLGFTDLSPLPGDRYLFSAAAEITNDPVLDGKNVGSALGILDARGKVIALRRLDTLLKVEGVHAFPDGRALLVADADSRKIKAPLLTTRWDALEK